MTVEVRRSINIVQRGDIRGNIEILPEPFEHQLDFATIESVADEIIGRCGNNTNRCRIE